MMSTLSTRLHNTRHAVKLYGNLFNWDLAAMGMVNYRTTHRNSEFIAGATFRGDAVIGLYGELAQHFQGRDDRPAFMTNADYRYFEGMLGADYSIDNKLFFNAEYLYNEHTINSKAVTITNAAAVSRTFFSKHTVYASARYQFNDLCNTSLNALWNISEGSVLATASFFYNVVQNADITLYAQYSEKTLNDVKFLEAFQPKWRWGLQVDVKF